MQEMFGSLEMSPTAFDLLMRMFIYDPTKRITAAEALEHPYFYEYNSKIELHIPRFSIQNSPNGSKSPNLSDL